MGELLHFPATCRERRLFGGHEQRNAHAGLLPDRQ